MPSTSEPDFMALCEWLYNKKPPEFSQDTDLQRICQLWAAASKLGIYRQMNTLLRLGMELMQPVGFRCSTDTVRWVYENTEEGCPLRGFIIAIFCQRASPGPAFFNDDKAWLSILRDACTFFRVLEKARKARIAAVMSDKTRNPSGEERDGLGEKDKDSTAGKKKVEGIFDSELQSKSAWGMDKHGFPVFNYKAIKEKQLSLGESVVKHPPPKYIVFGENGEDLPDRFFVLNLDDIKKGLAQGVKSIKP